MFKHELGVEAKEIISGFRGIITGRIEYLTGCRQYALSPRNLTKEGAFIDPHWFDEDKLVILNTKKLRIGVNNLKDVPSTESKKNDGADFPPPHKIG